MMGAILIISLIGIVSAESGNTNTEFTLASAQRACVFNSEDTISYWQWWDSGTNKVFKKEIGEPIPPMFSCYFEGGWPSNGCCPNKRQCDVLKESEAKCSLIAPDFCSDYNTYGDTKEENRAYCEGFNINTAINSIEEMTGIEGICDGFYSTPIDILGKTNCSQFTSNCRCYWDEVDDECKATNTGFVFCEGNLISEGNCSYQTTQKIDDCDNTGLLTYIWGSVWAGSEETKPSWCQGGNRIIDCSTMNLKLFSFWNIISVILILVIIYYFMNKKWRRRDEKKK